MGVIEDEIAARKQKRDEVIEQYKASKNQARSTLNDSDQPRLERQVEQLKRKYEELNREIEQLERGESPELTLEVLSRLKAEFRDEWEANLHWLDYDQPENALHKLIRVENQSAVLLYIQHRRRMKADLYIKRILKSESIFDKRRLHPPFTEDFSQEGRIDPQRFIERWLGNFKIDPAGLELKSAVERVIRTLHGAVVTGEILCLEIRVKEVSGDFLRWFREEFWQPLVGTMQQPPRGIRVIVLLTTETDLPKGQMQKAWCCPTQHFDCDKYCKIRLRNWQRSEIEQWISAYLNRSLDQRHLSAQDAGALAQQVYDFSDKGVPLHAHNYILGDLLTQVVEQLPGRCHATN